MLCTLRRYFTAEGCELRIGAYESLSTLCVYLESDAGGAGGAAGERNHWVKSRIAVVNQRRPERTEWKESAICTKTWNNSVLQVMRVRPAVMAVRVGFRVGFRVGSLPYPIYPTVAKQE